MSEIGDIIGKKLDAKPEEQKQEKVNDNNESDENEEVEQLEKIEEEPKPKKKPVGRPPVVHFETKISHILQKKSMNRGDLYRVIADKYPDEPISPDAISRIVSGQRRFYSTATLFRICGALRVTPNQVLDWEEASK